MNLPSIIIIDISLEQCGTITAIYTEHPSGNSEHPQGISPKIADIFLVNEQYNSSLSMTFKINDKQLDNNQK